ncbi:MAG: hypothetical protein ACI9EF_002951 [Pseudohongiellaceae bacterium]|jgi:hypothetical protein
MLIAQPVSLLSRSYLVTDIHGERVAELAISLIKEGARLLMDDKVFRIEREGLVSGPWQLKEGNEVRLEASPVAMIKGRFEMSVKGASLELAPIDGSSKGFTVVGPDWNDLGTISKPSLLSRRLKIELSELVPQQAQLFFLFLSLVLWSPGPH